MRGLFITGTDTGVGKTYVAVQIVEALRASGHAVGVYKPVETGVPRCEGQSDAQRLWEAAGRPTALADVCPQQFAAPLAPPRAARAARRTVDAALLRRGLDVWHRRCDVVVIEGAGGLLSPLSDNDYVADLAHDLGFPLLIVAPNTLGVINQTLQTLFVASHFRQGLDVAGIVLNTLPDCLPDPSQDSNAEELRQRCSAPLLAELAPHAAGFQPPVDWHALAR
jgi:dethiobiotin synthetase